MYNTHFRDFFLMDGVGFQTKVKLLSLFYINRVLGPDSHGILQFTLHHCLFIMDVMDIIKCMPYLVEQMSYV